ncbi:MAG: LysM peptidoglycan-binding domain-containing protein [Clostridium sp.]|nr:LysM peptidoglycan-binding domain-containing protein [Prevotella sp.]MCM1429334.1 LysM peptidoglycan-binding domain-containing protein [Clostridium sp.]MCM1475632.1 LysM peptidoglycan-binding domain-containing protein [Muribaculaceae bacterium]
MNYSRTFLFSALLGLASLGFAQGAQYLPQVNILGKNYYRYVAKNGESVYGIAKEMGWDQEVMTTINPGLKSSLKGGQIIFYPADGPTAVATPDNGDIRHTIKSGESVYGIAKQYNITTEEIYAANPGAEYGIKEGAVLIIPSEKLPVSDAGSVSPVDAAPLQMIDFVMHRVQPGETLVGVARRYNTSIAQILHDNPEISDVEFPVNAEVKVVPNSGNNVMIKEPVEVSSVIAIKTYKVKNNDTWEDVAKKFNVSIDILKEANPSISKLEKDMTIIVPEVSSVTVEKEVPMVDPRESTPEGRHEIYEEVKQDLVDEARLQEVRIALVLDDYTSPKDMEFTRGFISALNEMKDIPYSVVFKVIDGKDENFMANITEFSPNILFTTADKNFPMDVSDFGRDNSCWIVNVFDIKNEDYLTNPYMIQLLPNSVDFRNAIGEFISERFSDWNLIVAGEPDSSDTVAPVVMQNVDPSRVVSVSISEIQDFDTNPAQKYIVYATPSRSKDVEDILDRIIVLKQKNPEAEVVTFGRPNWITLSSLGEKMSAADVYFPSRFYFDPSLSSGREFIDNYKELYGHTPVKSYPVYAVAGYDVANYFVPAMHRLNGNLNELGEATVGEGLQNDYHISRNVDSSAGLLNSLIYIVKYNTFGNIDKIRIEK